jgi:hypothetical protein
MAARATTGGGIGTNQHAIKGRAKTKDTVGAARAGALTDPAPTGWQPPAALHGWTTFNGETQVDLATRVAELGWTDATPVRISGEQSYDDNNYFTPTLEVLVRGDVHINDAAKAAYRAWVIDTGGEELANDPNITPAEFGMDDAIDVIQGVHREHLDAAGVLIIHPESVPDVFDPVDTDEIDPDEWTWE